MPAGRFVPIAVVAAAALLGACSDTSSSPPASGPGASAPVQPPANPQAAKSLAMYRDLLKSQSYELAGPIGQEIVANYPGTPEASEVQQTLADTVAKGTAIATKRRLEKLWIYQTGTESGGEQSTASIYASQPVTADRVRLILRRHSAWGESVYLFGSGKGFDCGKSCTIATRFDDDPPQKLKAYSPATGEPAVFITDDHAFIAKMAKAAKVSFDVGVKGKGPQTLVFETGGYDAGKFAPIAKPKK